MPPFLALAAWLAQAQVPADDAPAQLERIRKALDHQPSTTVEAGTDESGRTLFRMSVRAPRPAEPLWNDWSNVPPSIRPWWRYYHHEFLEQVTKEEFRSATLYPVGIPVEKVIEALAKRVRAAQRKSHENAARQEVRDAVAELTACRADPSRPGC